MTVALSRGGDRAILTVLTGLNAGQVFTIDTDETTIGRGREAHVRIEDVGISRAHSRVVRTMEGQFVVDDLGLERRCVGDGDIRWVGDDGVKQAAGIEFGGKGIEQVGLDEGDARCQVKAFSVVAGDGEV